MNVAGGSGLGGQDGRGGGLCGRPAVSGRCTDAILTHCLALLPMACFCIPRKLGFPGGSAVRNLSAVQETRVPSLGREDSLEEEMATHTSILAWRIPWTEEPGGLQSMGSQKNQKQLRD